jgi:hypothetical protein
VEATRNWLGTWVGEKEVIGEQFIRWGALGGVEEVEENVVVEIVVEVTV